MSRRGPTLCGRRRARASSRACWSRRDRRSPCASRLRLCWPRRACGFVWSACRVGRPSRPSPKRCETRSSHRRSRCASPWRRVRPWVGRPTRRPNTALIASAPRHREPSSRASSGCTWTPWWRVSKACSASSPSPTTERSLGPGGERRARIDWSRYNYLRSKDNLRVHGSRLSSSETRKSRGRLWSRLVTPDGCERSRSRTHKTTSRPSTAVCIWHSPRARGTASAAEIWHLFYPASET